MASATNVMHVVQSTNHAVKIREPQWKHDGIIISKSEGFIGINHNGHGFVKNGSHDACEDIYLLLSE